MKKQILLPNNTFGGCIMLLVVALLQVVPAAVTLWLVSLVAPWWVAVPCAVAAGLVVMLLTVKFK